MFTLVRSSKNPLLAPNIDHAWESKAAFNPCPIKDGGTTHCVYRAMSDGDYIEGQTLALSTIGYGKYSKGVLSGRRPLITPDYPWERFGCEDPRVTKIDGMYYIFYTAIGAYPMRSSEIRAAVALTRDFKTVHAKYLVTPFNAKAMALFPEKINGKFTAILSAFTDEGPLFGTIALAQFEKEEDMWSKDYWHDWQAHVNDHEIKIGRDGKERIEVGVTPVKTPKGWLLIYCRIQNHNTSPIFTVEAILLDLKDPRKVIGATKGPLMVPEESYEEFGQMKDVIFPSGALVEGDTLSIWYGATDTTGCTARVSLAHLLASMTGEDTVLTRSAKNPILAPMAEHAWENKAVFNPAALRIKGLTHILYRATSADDTSTIGYAASRNGTIVTERLAAPVYVPRAPFEGKGKSGNSGCEDPRLTLIKDKIYILYTAYNGIEAPQVAASSILVKDFLKRKWNWSAPRLLTPTGIDDKDSCLLSEPINGEHLLFHRVRDHVCLDPLSSLDFEQPIETATPLFGPRRGMWDSMRVGIAAPPIKTGKGWLLFYHGIGAGTYRVGAMLLDLKNPWNILRRSTNFLFEPVMPYEMEGVIPKVVFPCGATVEGDTVFLYYGGADTVVGVATGSLKDILARLAV